MGVVLTLGAVVAAFDFAFAFFDFFCFSNLGSACGSAVSPRLANACGGDCGAGVGGGVGDSNLVVVVVVIVVHSAILFNLEFY